MRVTFPRLPDHQRAWALVERDDGVVYRLYGGTAGPRLPHDIMHLVVERELRIKDGIWAGIAAGATADPPDPRAELLTDLCPRRGAGHADSGEDQAAGRGQAVGAAQCRATQGAEVDPVVIAVAARALQVEAARWARLRVGEELTYDWPGK